MDTKKLCMGCMHILNDEEKCPNCGLEADAVQEKPFLPLRTVISGRYLVGTVIEQNGDGVSYIGWDLSANIPVTVREFFPSSISTRAENALDIIVKKDQVETYIDFMTEFTRLWSQLIDISKHSAMIDIYDIVEENNTVYAIYEYVNGITLREYLLRTPTGYISWEKARTLFMPVLSTISTLHSAGVIHRGISPTTLIFDTDGKLRLTGFCIAPARNARGILNEQLFPGYAAMEQYGLDEQQGPWTDVYSFAAVLYRTLIGSDPIDAKSRVTNDRLMIPGRFAEQLPAYVINGLINALQIFPEDRTSSAEQCRAELTAAPSASVSLDNNTTPDGKANFAGTVAASSVGHYITDDDTPVSGLENFHTQYSGDYPDETLHHQDPAASQYSANGKKKKKKNTAVQVVIGVLAVLIAIIALFFVLNYTGVIKFNTSGSSTEETTYNEVEVPNFVNRIYDGNTSSAAISLNQDFLKHFIFAVTYEYSDNVDSGIVISQDIKAGTHVKDNSTIRLVVSKGKMPINLTNVEGMTYDSAVALLSKAGFVVEMDTIMQPNDGSHAAYSVYKMSPSMTNKTYDKDTKVVLTVWGEPQTTAPAPIEIPDVPVSQQTEEPTEEPQQDVTQENYND